MTDPIALVRRFAAVLEHGRLEELDELLTPDCHDGNPIAVQGLGRTGIALKLAWCRAVEPGARSRFVSFDVHGNEVVAVWITNHPDGGESNHLGRFCLVDDRIAAFEVQHVV